MHDGVEDNLSVGVDILQLMPSNVLQESGHGENCSGTEPTAHVITTDVTGKRVGRNLEDIILQFFQRGNASYLFLRHGVAEDEVAKAHVFLHQMM